MFLVYVDESGNTGLNLKDQQQPVFILAAMILHESKWFVLEGKFLEISRKYLGSVLPSPYELHTMDLKNGRGSFKELSFERRLSFRDDLLTLLIEDDVRIIYRRIIKSKFSEFCESQYGSGIKVNPYIMALPFVCVEVDHFIHEAGRQDLGMLIFDEQQENLNDAELSLRTLRLDSDSSLKTSNIVEKGFFINSSKSYALQLVDLAAYYIRKYEEHKLQLRVSDYDKQTFPKIEKLVSTGIGSNVVDVLEWVKHNYISK